MPALEILDANDATQRARWMSLWSRWPGREVQAHPAYLELFADAGEQVRAAACDSETALILYPFIQRPVPSELDPTSSMFDLTSPYGYGGAYGHGDEVERFAQQEFWPAFAEWAGRSAIVCEVLRLAVGAAQLLMYPGERIERLRNIVVPTAMQLDVLWTRYAHKVRKNVQKAQRAGVTVDVDPGGEELGEFLRIYLATMNRRAAAESYKFPGSFFERLNATLIGQVVYFHARHDGRIISTELALVSADRIYSFLGGTDDSAFDLRPNDLLKHAMIGWAHAQGKSEFVLGGGYRPDDGIYKYKECFAPDGGVPFFTGQRIFDERAYEELVELRQVIAARRGSELVSGYFPAYRAPFRRDD